MGADGVCRLGGGKRLIGYVEGNFAGSVEQPGLGVARVDDTLDADNGADMILPVRGFEVLGGIEDRDSAVFVAVAAFVMAFVGVERLCRIGDGGDRLKQGRLVGLDLYDQSDAGLFGDFEVFF